MRPLAEGSGDGSARAPRATRVIGMMSGTSFDAVDAAALDLHREGDVLVATLLGSVSAPYPEQTRAAIAAALPPAPTSAGDVCRIDTLVGQAFAAVAARADEELCGGRADLVVSHGQTLFHWVQDGVVRGTLQVGQPAWIAERTGCAVVSDLRSADVAAGGQGAPLVSAVDVLWLAGLEPAGRGRAAAVNLGGIANVTLVADGAEPQAFDTGPANALLDAYVAHTSGGAATYDAGGRLAAAGDVDEALLAAFLAEPYYARPAPKTTGKELFDLDHVLRRTRADHRVEDVAATLTELTARTVADAVYGRADLVVTSGGGTRNPVLLARLAARLPGVQVTTSDALGLPSASKEAVAFAVLGHLSVSGLPGTVPSCTGARGPRVLGRTTPGRRPLPPVPALATAPRALRTVGA